MPAIDRQRWTVLEPLLDKALELTPEELGPWLEELSASAPDVAADLNALLTDDVSATRDGFLAQPLDLTLEGLEIGAYTLEKPLGHGGMGSVWLARRTDGRFEGKAAVKLLNLSLLSTAGQERFRREGSMLARLAHPGIARLLDAGVSRGGQPYLILEYVDGDRLDAYALKNNLTPDDTIRLFMRVLEAVGHAHANLVVHRDLKPSNILVKADGAVKLLDFGIAKLAGEELSTDAITVDGARVFTPQFAAPEQARGETITTATDVYSLGVILYMMLSGRHPTGMDGRTSADVVKQLLEVEPPMLKPRDLGAIVDKALRKDPANRYKNVETFADDLNRYLRHEPVSVGRDPALYRTRKFVRRHSTAVTIGATIAAVLIAATTFSVTQMREATRQRDAAVLASQRADAQAEFGSMLMSQLGDKPMTVREILDRARAALDHQFTTDSGFMTSALVQLSDMYSLLGDGRSDGNIRTKLLARADSIATSSRDTAALIQVQCNRGDNLRAQGKYEQAEQIFVRAESMLKKHPDPSVEAECMLRHAVLENDIGKPDKSAPAISRAIAIRDSLGRTHDTFYVTLLDTYSYTLDLQKHVREAIVATNHGVALLDTIGQGQTTISAVLRHNLGVTYDRLGEVATAESILHDVLHRLADSDPSGRLPEQPLIHYAHSALYQGLTDSAIKYFTMLRDQAVVDRNTYWQARALFGLAQAQLQSGQSVAAKRTTDALRRIASLPRTSAELKLIRDNDAVDINTLDGLLALTAGDTAKASALFRTTLMNYGYYDKKRRSSTLHSTLMLAARSELALGHADSAFALAAAARKTATRDSLSQTRSARVGEAQMIQAKAELLKGDRIAARADAQAAFIALRSGGGSTNPRTKETEALTARLR
ncbi:MAG TPA: serine/threonine-protein kinase [Gemmatimonadaceae bacterium]|jgi:serine/threonine-protein kinase